MFQTRIILRSVFSILLSLASTLAFSQRDHCGTIPYTQQQRDAGVLRQTQEQFEQWIRAKANARTGSPFARSAAGPYKIPVVVHVIHNGEAIGDGANISDEQILSQIRVLNEDFRRENPDAVNTPPEFLSVAGQMDIEFILARRDPEGIASNGIVRVDGQRSSWTSSDAYELKSLSYWPAEDYMNIWVCNITDYLGLAQFPVSDLPGLENSSNNRLTDGVIIWHGSFGSIDHGDFDLDPFYNKGRTATHEISHFFGLNHIWGDDDACAATDYVDDTPNQDTYTRGCPAHPQQSCGNVEMFQNFLDYTDDECMNLFTQGQIARMQIVIESSPRRASLLTSPGTLAPDPVPNDIGIRSILSPSLTQCSNLVNPSIVLKNYGTTPVTTARVRLTINNNVIQTQDVAMNLQPGDTTVVSFNALTLATGQHTVSFEILLTNGLIDGDAISNNNIVTRPLFIPSTIEVPFTEAFNSMPSTWAIGNPDQQITWELARAPKRNEENKALLMRFYDYEDNVGEQDVVYTPVFDLSNADSALLLFDLAHARYDQSNDALKVIVMTGCQDISQGQVVYDSAGSRLATVSSTRSFFTPNSVDDWERESVPLDQFIGEPLVQIAFVGVNDYGNNLYIDNVTVAENNFTDANLSAVVSPGLVTCQQTGDAQILIENTGITKVQSVTVAYGTSESSLNVITFNELELEAQEEEILFLPGLSLSEGENTFLVRLQQVGSDFDDNRSNDSIDQKIVLNTSQDRIPLRQNFETPFPDWTIANTDEGMVWSELETNQGISLYYNAFDNGDVGDEAWLVSPVLDLSNYPEASLLFDVSYKSGAAAREELKIMVSRDCGNTYEEADFLLPDVDPYEGGWAPQSDEDWFRNEVDLSDFGREAALRVAFVVTNANGNNLYLDNIEFFVTSDPQSVTIEEPFSIFGYNMAEINTSELKIGFNLPARSDVHCQIVDTMGRTVSEIKWIDVLNQTFDLPADEDMASGVYIVRLRIGEKTDGSRIFISR